MEFFVHLETRDSIHYILGLNYIETTTDITSNLICSELYEVLVREHIIERGDGVVIYNFNANRNEVTVVIVNDSMFFPTDFSPQQLISTFDKYFTMIRSIEDSFTVITFNSAQISGGGVLNDRYYKVSHSCSIEFCLGSHIPSYTPTTKFSFEAVTSLYSMETFIPSTKVVDDEKSHSDESIKLSLDELYLDKPTVKQSKPKEIVRKRRNSHYISKLKRS